jgi:hypothetical protein
MAWIRCTKQNLCPICGRDDYCEFTEDGEIAYCMRAESDKPHRKGGWIHRLKERDPGKRYKVNRPKPAVEPPRDFGPLALQYRVAMTDSQVRWLAGHLGVEESALERMETGFSRACYTFPMVDANCETIGIRMRTCGGFKLAIKGSRNGLFIPQGVFDVSEQILFICEGESDTAAMLSMGFDVIGRPSCQGGTDHIIEFIKGRRRKVVIVEDRDVPRNNPDGTQLRPGVDGARRLANDIKSLCSGVRVLIPPAKDIRAWYNDGATAKDVISLLKNKKFTI